MVEWKSSQIAKWLLKRCFEDKSSIKLALLNYRNILRNPAFQSPKQRLLSRITDSPLPSISQKLQHALLENVKQNLEAERVQIHNPLTKQWESVSVGSKARSVTVETGSENTYCRNTMDLRKSSVRILKSLEVTADYYPTPCINNRYRDFYHRLAQKSTTLRIRAGRWNRSTVWFLRFL